MSQACLNFFTKIENDRYEEQGTSLPGTRIARGGVTNPNLCSAEARSETLRSMAELQNFTEYFWAMHVHFGQGIKISKPSCQFNESVVIVWLSTLEKINFNSAVHRAYFELVRGTIY